jgi:hypothetical protein
MWAIASGIEGNLAAYEAVVADLKKSRQDVENFYLLGDIIGPTAESNRLVTLDKLTDPTPTVLSPRRIIGVGSVGRVEGKASYTLYHPGSNKLEFKTVRYGVKKGFG